MRRWVIAYFYFHFLESCHMKRSTFFFNKYTAFFYPSVSFVNILAYHRLEVINIIKIHVVNIGNLWFNIPWERQYR